MSPQHNFRHYRHELRQRKLPVLPYFGIYLRDFTFINDGNEKYKPDGSAPFNPAHHRFLFVINSCQIKNNHAGSINEKYVQLLYERAKEVQHFQSVPYSFFNHFPQVQEFLASVESKTIGDEVCTQLQHN